MSLTNLKEFKKDEEEEPIHDVSIMDNLDEIKSLIDETIFIIHGPETFYSSKTEAYEDGKKIGRQEILHSLSKIDLFLMFFGLKDYKN